MIAFLVGMLHGVAHFDEQLAVAHVVESCCWSQYSVIGTPLTNSITKYGRPVSVVPASSTLAMFG